MVYSLTWLPEVLLDAGLRVHEQPGWRDRGLGDVGKTRGVMCHHTATNIRDRAMPTLNVITNGRPGLRGPLAQLGLGRDGHYYIIAAGLAQHAGRGEWNGIQSGNTSFIGIEAENSGLADDPWPEEQMDAYVRGVAAILSKIGAGADMCCGHKEYRRPLGYKNDPSFDMTEFRAKVDAVMRGTAEVRPAIPLKDPSDRHTLERGARGDDVKALQTGLGIKADGVFGPNTEAAVRAFQRGKGLRADGIVGPRTWAAIGAPQPATT